MHNLCKEKFHFGRDYSDHLLYECIIVCCNCISLYLIFAHLYERFITSPIYALYQTPNPAWPPPSLFLPVVPERIKDLSVKNWSSIAGSGPVPWRQAPSLFNASNAQSELHPRMPFEVEMPGGMDRFLVNDRLSVPSLDKRRKEDSSERLMNGGLKIGPLEILENGTTGIYFLLYEHVLQRKKFVDFFFMKLFK